MTKHHPIDVRYKGPSTAYRGSAKQPHTASLPTQKTSLHKATPAATQISDQSSPWDKSPPQLPRPPAHTPPRKDKPAATAFGIIGSVFNVFHGVVNTIKYVYFAVIAVVFLLAFVL
jgi:hypothetical protein